MSRENAKDKSNSCFLWFQVVTEAFLKKLTDGICEGMVVPVLKDYKEMTGSSLIILDYEQMRQSAYDASDL